MFAAENLVPLQISISLLMIHNRLVQTCNVSYAIIKKHFITITVLEHFISSILCKYYIFQLDFFFFNLNFNGNSPTAPLSPYWKLLVYMYKHTNIFSKQKHNANCMQSSELHTCRLQEQHNRHPCTQNKAVGDGYEIPVTSLTSSQLHSAEESSKNQTL